MASKYVYRSHLPTEYVRLLTLVSDGENFHGSLEEFRRDSVPYFNALSWCWWSRGERPDTAFTCDGQIFPVSHHLYELLSNLNPKDAPSSVRIWIDSICINQEHVEEKNIHVAHMHEIYGQARNVVVWLGVSEDESDLAMDSKKISELNRTLQRLPPSNVALSMTDPELPHADDPIWKAIGRICDRDWFYRTWIIQEIALARKAEILCGGHRLDWDEFVNVVGRISRAGLASLCRGPRNTGLTRPDGFGVLMDLSWTRTMVQNNDLSMNYILHMVRLREVTKPVDKVYGLLGIVNEDMRNAVKVNYAENDKQYWRAYVELASKIITADDPGFWLLCMASSRERPPELPTWCPNLNSLTPEYLDFGSQTWRAGLEDGVRADPIRLQPNSSSLLIPGFRIDIVDQVIHIGGPYATAVGKEDKSRESSTAAFLARDRTCLDLSLQLIPDAHEAKDAYARTLIVNTWISGLPIPPSDSQRVQNAYQDSHSYLSDITAISSPSTATASSQERNQFAQHYITQLGWWQERPFYTTQNGRIGRGASDMRAGDVICVFYRAGPLFILRWSLEMEIWRLVGDGYLHGCMDLGVIAERDRGVDEVFCVG